MRWKKMNSTKIPTVENIADYVNNPIWMELYTYITITYDCKPTFEYSRCAWPGWNIKFKKAGKNLCTVYPFEGYIWTLVVIGRKEIDQFNIELPEMSDYVHQLFQEAPEGMGQHWLKFELEDAQRLVDVKRCIAIKRGKP